MIKLAKILVFLVELGLTLALFWNCGKFYLIGSQQPMLVGSCKWAIIVLFFYAPIVFLLVRKLRRFGPLREDGWICCLTGLCLFLSVILSARLTAEIIYAGRAGGATKEMREAARREGIELGFRDQWFKERIDSTISERNQFVVLTLFILLYYAKSYNELRESNGLNRNELKVTRAIL